MKLTDMIKSYTQNMNLKATLNKKIKLSDGVIFEKGTVSEFLIKKENGNYHFEALGSACDVKPEEITILDKTNAPVKKTRKKSI